MRWSSEKSSKARQKNLSNETGSVLQSSLDPYRIQQLQYRVASIIRYELRRLKWLIDFFKLLTSEFYQTLPLQ